MRRLGRGAAIRECSGRFALGSAQTSPPRPYSRTFSSASRWAARRGSGDLSTSSAGTGRWPATREFPTPDVTGDGHERAVVGSDGSPRVRLSHLHHLRNRLAHVGGTSCRGQLVRGAGQLPCGRRRRRLGPQDCEARLERSRRGVALADLVLGDPPPLSRPPQHLVIGLPRGIPARRVDLHVGHQPVPVLHDDVPGHTELGLAAVALTRQPGLGVRGRTVVSLERRWPRKSTSGLRPTPAAAGGPPRQPRLGLRWPPRLGLWAGSS